METSENRLSVVDEGIEVVSAEFTCCYAIILCFV